MWRWVKTGCRDSTNYLSRAPLGATDGAGRLTRWHALSDRREVQFAEEFKEGGAPLSS